MVAQAHQRYCRYPVNTCSDGIKRSLWCTTIRVILDLNFWSGTCKKCTVSILKSALKRERNSFPCSLKNETAVVFLCVCMSRTKLNWKTKQKQAGEAKAGGIATASALWGLSDGLLDVKTQIVIPLLIWQELMIYKAKIRDINWLGWVPHSLRTPAGNW